VNARELKEIGAFVPELYERGYTHARNGHEPDTEFDSLAETDSYWAGYSMGTKYREP
jgi:hypothetical protein